ncbi:MAG: hypothetical protein QG608_1223, partial [Actinomycetota bacterium]|nr:hypothetical protein [Actinomycetota bacterium]
MSVSPDTSRPDAANRSSGPGTVLVRGVRPLGGDPVDLLLRDGVIAQIGRGAAAPVAPGARLVPAD